MEYPVDIWGKNLGKSEITVYWLNCKDDVKDCCRKFTVCASTNGPHKRRKAPLKQYNVGSPFERIATDVSGPFPITEKDNKYI